MLFRSFTWPAGVQVADLIVNHERWATIVGLYGLTVNRHGESCGSGHYSVPKTLGELRTLLDSRVGQRLILAGDFNLWPTDASRKVAQFGLVDLIEETAAQRPPLDGCSGCTLGNACGHLWTHRNGNSPKAARQQIDYI